METQINIKELNTWEDIITKKPMIISGPCSAETEEQTIHTAKELHSIGINIFRAGIWKPRTRPNSFEGIGNIGLDWMRTIKKETGMLLSTEVANVKHVYESLKAGIDILWIGARTTANPFAIQEIAEALKGIDIPVFVKNPLNPDINLWLGAIERFNNAGLSKIGAIHRGFSSYEKSIYRNIPQWQIPIELKTRVPEIPLLCDPSHISGNRTLLQDLSQKAIDLNFDGLMIESHLNPDKAWSDAKQQVTPIELKELLMKLVIRKVKPEGVSLDALEDLRFKIDKCDDEIIRQLEMRMEIVKLIGKYKKQNKMTILQANRWDSIVKKTLVKATQKDLNPEFISKIFKTIHQESIHKQTVIMNNE